MDNNKFSGVHINFPNKITSINQFYYIEDVKVLPPDATFSEFRYARANQSWLVHSHPDPDNSQFNFHS